MSWCSAVVTSSAAAVVAAAAEGSEAAAAVASAGISADWTKLERAGLAAVGSAATGEMVEMMPVEPAAGPPVVAAESDSVRSGAGSHLTQTGASQPVVVVVAVIVVVVPVAVGIARLVVWEVVSWLVESLRLVGLVD